MAAVGQLPTFGGAFANVRFGIKCGNPLGPLGGAAGNHAVPRAQWPERFVLLHREGLHDCNMTGIMQRFDRQAGWVAPNSNSVVIAYSLIPLSWAQLTAVTIALERSPTRYE